MKNQTFVFALAILGLVAGCGKEPGRTSTSAPGPFWRHYLVGTSALAKDTNGATLRTVWSDPATRLFRNETLDKIARAPARIWQKQPDHAAMVRPLLDDLLQAESFSEVTGSTNHPDTVLALRLSDERARVWQTNLWQLLEGWKVGTPRPVVAGKFQGWEVRVEGSSNVVQFVQGEGWTVLGVGMSPLNGLPRVLGKLGRKESLAAKGNGWLNLEADLPRLGTWLPLFRTFPLAPLQLTIVGDGVNLRSTGSVRLHEPLPWSFEPWKIPTNRIDESFVSFVVAQGFAPLLEKVKAINQLGLPKMPNQFCMWGLPTMQSQTFAAIPVPDVTNSIRRISTTLPPLVESILGTSLGTFLYASNAAALIWQGFPLIEPYIRPYHETGQDYLLSGMFPISPRTNHPPQALFEQLRGRNDLAYYDWEITEHRVVQAKQLYRLADLVNRRQTLPMESPSQNWMTQIGPLLGNSVTEITVVSPHELSFVRKSPVGLTGVEIVSLVHWIESPGFPVTYEPLPRLTPPPGARRLSVP